MERESGMPPETTNLRPTSEPMAEDTSAENQQDKQSDLDVPGGKGLVKEEAKDRPPTE